MKVIQRAALICALADVSALRSFDYSTCGSVETVAVPSNADISFTVKGARGGVGGDNSKQGHGGTTTGSFNTGSATSVSLHVGCKGTGGNGQRQGGGGGGASAIVLPGDVVVAVGGGGGGTSGAHTPNGGKGGNGGGATGETGGNDHCAGGNGGTGGSQSSAGITPLSYCGVEASVPLTAAGSLTLGCHPH